MIHTFPPRLKIITSIIIILTIQTESFPLHAAYYSLLAGNGSRQVSWVSRDFLAVDFPCGVDRIITYIISACFRACSNPSHIKSVTQSFRSVVFAVDLHE